MAHWLLAAWLAELNGMTNYSRPLTTSRKLPHLRAGLVKRYFRDAVVQPSGFSCGETLPSCRSSVTRHSAPLTPRSGFSLLSEGAWEIVPSRFGMSPFRHCIVSLQGS